MNPNPNLIIPASQEMENVIERGNIVEIQDAWESYKQSLILFFKDMKRQTTEEILSLMEE